MRNFYIMIAAFIFPLTVGAQSFIRQFSVNKSLNYSSIARSGATELGYAAQATTEENISSVMIAKFNRLLYPEWVNFYTDSVNTPGTDLRQQITACRNGGFAVAFTPETRDGSVYILKTDSQGNILWNRKYNLSSGNQGTFLMETPEGNILVVGNRRADFVVSAAVLSVNGANGRVQWFKTLTIPGQNAIVGAIAPASDSGFVIGGSGAGNITFIARYNKLGDMLWTRTYQSPAQGNYLYQDIKSITQTKDGGFAYTGLAPSSIAGNGYDLTLVKLARNGSLQWASQTGTSGEDAGFSIQQNDDLTYSVTGTFTSVNTWLIKFNKTGDASIFQRVLNAGFLAFPTTVEDNKGRHIMSGTFYTGLFLQPHGFLATIESDGTACGGYLAHRPITALNIAPFRSVVVEQDVTGEATADTAYFKKTTPALFSTLFCSQDPSSKQMASATATMQAHASLKAEVLANPVRTTMQLKLSGGNASTNWLITVSDMHGRTMLNQKVEGPYANQQINVSGWASGLYIVNVVSANWRASIKVMVIR